MLLKSREITLKSPKIMLESREIMLESLGMMSTKYIHGVKCAPTAGAQFLGHPKESKKYFTISQNKYMELNVVRVSRAS